MDKLFSELTEDEKQKLDCIALNAWDLIQANSGGHPSITNISGLNFIGRGKRPPGPRTPKSKEPRIASSEPKYVKSDAKKEGGETEYLSLMKTIASKIKDKLETEVSKY